MVGIRDYVAAIFIRNFNKLFVFQTREERPNDVAGKVKTNFW